MCGPSANATRPVCSFSGTRSRKRLAAAFAAVSRSGATSVAFIEPDVSVTSITDAFSTGTATVASGRASAVISPASARHSSAGGIARRARPVRPATAASVAVAGKRTTYFAGRLRASKSASSAAGMAARREQEQRGLEAHRRLRPRPRSQSASVVNSTCRARARRRCDLSSSRRASSAACEPPPQLRARRVGLEPLPGLGIDERQMPGVGQLALTRVDDLDREHVVALRERRRARVASRSPRGSRSRRPRGCGRG